MSAVFLKDNMNERRAVTFLYTLSIRGVVKGHRIKTCPLEAVISH